MAFIDWFSYEKYTSAANYFLKTGNVLTTLGGSSCRYAGDCGSNYICVDGKCKSAKPQKDSEPELDSALPTVGKPLRVLNALPRTAAVPGVADSSRVGSPVLAENVRTRKRSATRSAPPTAKTTQHQSYPKGVH